jgi:hypothetical protein
VDSYRYKKDNAKTPGNDPNTTSIPTGCLCNPRMEAGALRE